MKSVVAFAGVIVALVPHVALAQEEIQLEPAGEWEVGSGDESCWISRQFGNEGDGVFLRLESFGPDRGYYRVFMRGKALPQRDSGLLQFEYAFTPDSSRIPASGVMARSGNSSTLSFSTGLQTSEQAEKGQWDPIAGARETEIRQLVMQFSRGDPVALQLGSMSGPLGQLRECAGDLPAKWGFDAEQQRNLSRQPARAEGSPDFEAGNFPWEYLRTAQSVTIYYRLMVDAAGVPTSCVVQSPRLERAASDITCQFAMQQRFEPALDASGEPVASYVPSSFSFRTKRRNGNN